MGHGYYAQVTVTDYGPFVTKLILPMPAPILSEISPEQWSVYVERCDSRGEVLQLPRSWMAQDAAEPSKGYCRVLRCYGANLQGEPCTGGDCLALELAYGVEETLTSEISAFNGLNAYIKSLYTVTQLSALETAGGSVSGMIFDRRLGTRCDDTCGFLQGKSRDAVLPLGYGYWIPQKPGEKKPLIVWLHGAGEGGTDPTVAYTANKVTAMTKEAIQRKFGEGGAYLLVPQCPTMWMDNGTHEYTRTGKSMYVRALKSLIDEFLENNPAVDRSRIYLGGDSNGGFMTMRMAIDYPDFFAAIFPTCEALFDETISDADIQRLAKLPIWFVHSQDDPVVNPAETAAATYRRLTAAGARNVHFTFWDKVEDLHGEFRRADGSPWRYIGHFVWIHVYNDDCRVDFDGRPVIVDGKEAGIFDWLAAQKKQNGAP